MGQYHRVHLRRLKHIDILTLLLLVGHVVDDLLLLLLLDGLAVLVKYLAIHFLSLINDLGFHLLAVFVHRSGFRIFACRRAVRLVLSTALFCVFRISVTGRSRLTRSILSVIRLVGIDLVDLQTLGQRHVLAVQILEKDIVGHLLAELVVLQAAELDEGTDIIPVFLVLFLLGLAHAGQLIRHLLCDVLADLLDKTVVLQRASGHVERQVRAVDHTFEQHQELGNHFLDIVRDKHLIVI